MDPWIHCKFKLPFNSYIFISLGNKCYSQPTPTSKFWFTSCGHILCEGCAEPPNEIQKRKQCILCHVDAGYMQINRNMRPDLMDLFKPPKVLVSEYLTRINTTIAFQSYQRGHLTKYKDEQVKWIRLR
uniref:RING-type domain-containing protein n=1 Tax=Meloidogyne hapla TaxID=6305 RepID=A0A1I8BQC3_MELHA